MKNCKTVLSVLLCLSMIMGMILVPFDSQAATKLKLSKTKATMTVGDSLTLTAKWGKKKASGAKWKTSNKKIVTVTKGKLKAKKKGKAKITATYKGKKSVCNVTVVAKSTNTNTNTNSNQNNSTNTTPTPTPTPTPVAEPVYAISQSTASVEVEKTLKLTVTEDGSVINSGVTWSSSNANVASVSYGTVTAKGPGNATITATAGGKQLTCTVTVTVPNYTISNTKATLDTGDRSKNTIQLYLKNGSTNVSGATWESDAEDVATVDEDGLVTAMGDGTANIIATKYGKECECTVKVDGFVFDRDVDIEYGLTTITIDFDLKTDGLGNPDPAEVEELKAQGCTVSGKNVTKNQQCETAKYTFKRLPGTLTEIQSFFDNPEENDTEDLKIVGSDPNYGGFNAMAATICAACTFKGGSNPADPYFSKDPVWDMFEYINGPAASMDISNSVRQNACSSMKSAIQACGENVYKSYFQGATPYNNYTPKEPYVLEMYKGPYFINEKSTITGDRPTTYMIFVPGYKSNCNDLNGVSSYGVDKYIDVYYSTKMKRWFSYKNQFLHMIANEFKTPEEEL